MGHERQGLDDGVAKVGASMVTNASDVLIPYELMRSEIYITFMEGIGVILVTFRKLTTHYVIPRLPSSALLLATSAIFLHCNNHICHRRFVSKQTQRRRSGHQRL